MISIRPVASTFIFCFITVTIAGCSSSGDDATAPAGSSGGGGSGGTSTAAGSGGSGGGGGGGGPSGLAGAPSTPADRPETVDVPTTSGVIVGPTFAPPAPDPVTVQAFSITKTPITVGQYRSCVTAGACTPPLPRDPAHFLYPNVCAETPAPPSNLSDTLLRNTWFLGDELLPQTCLVPMQMSAYCSWVGGRLPNEDEWYLAARGKDQHKFAWGDSEPNCDEFVAADQVAFDSMPVGPGGKPCSGKAKDLTLFEVGQHPAGDSPTGAADVSVSVGEIFAIKPGAVCGVGTFCSVGSNAEVDEVGEVTSADGLIPSQNPVNKPFVRVIDTFRCVLPQ